MRNPRIEELFLGLSHSDGFKGLVSALGTTAGATLRLSGLTLTAKAAYAALLFRETERPLILVADGSKQAEALFPLLRSFCGLLDAGITPLLLPALDTLPGQAMAPHAEILARRAATLVRLAHGYSGIVVTPVQAALTRTEAPDYYRQLTMRLRVNDEIPFEDLTSHLQSVGYEKRDPVEMVGEYSVRGGILDVFSPDETQPVRPGIPALHS